MKKSALFMFHLFFWIFSGLLVILAFQLLSIPAHIFGQGGPTIAEQFKALLITLPVAAVIFYPSYFFLNFFVKRQIRFLWLALSYGVLIGGQLFFEYYKNKNSEKLLDILITFFPILYFNVFGFLFRTFIEWIKDKKIKAELEKDKFESQLELLKSQINPHFLFNTLNNIDVLILDDPQKASLFLKKLSEILRFLLYESGGNKIPLSKEIEYIKKYIDLQKIRTSNESFVKLEISGSASSVDIAPMIFIHFIENAFKYATNKKVENAVVIEFNISEKQLTFLCKNHKNTSDTLVTDKKGLGVGLIRQRLDLTYDKAYNLDIRDEDNWYIVNLNIQFDDH